MKKCKNCKKWHSLNKYVITDHTTMSRSKVCIECAPDQVDVPIPTKAFIYVCGFYDEELDQRYIKIGYTTKTAQARLKSILQSWSKRYGVIPYSKVLLELDVPPLNSYNIEQKILKKLRDVYRESVIHKNLKIDGYKETFIVQSASESRLLVNYVKDLVKLEVAPVQEEKDHHG